jgi:Ca2+-binding RTX toxin-like protein
MMALPAGAAASVVEVTASAGPAAEEYLEYRASTGEANRVSIGFTDDYVVIKDSGVKRIRVARSPFGACRATNPRRVVCPRMSVFSMLRDRDDRIGFVPGADQPEPTGDNPFAFDEEYEDGEGSVEETTYVDAGSGDDRVVGSRFDDAIEPGPGADKVFGRGGPDWVSIDADSAADHIRGGGGADALYTFVESEVVDLAARTVSAGGETDSVAGFERVNTGPGDDTLRGTDRAEALYGGGGVDTVDGRGGSDALYGDSPATIEGRSSANTIIGGDGDDFIDARSRNPVPATPIDCGAGADVFTGEVDDRPNASCEQVAFRFDNGKIYEVPPDYDDRLPAFPVAREPDGDPVYAMKCPTSGRPPHGGCSGTVALTSATEAATPYGSAPYNLAPGATGNVPVELNAAGRAAVAAGEPVAVHISGELAPPPNANVPPLAYSFGWQHVIAP